MIMKKLKHTEKRKQNTKPQQREKCELPWHNTKHLFK